jgi:hypothetical protein
MNYIFYFGKRISGTPILEINIDFSYWVFIFGTCVDSTIFGFQILCFHFLYYKKL